MGKIETCPVKFDLQTQQKTDLAPLFDILQMSIIDFFILPIFLTFAYDFSIRGPWYLTFIFILLSAFYFGPIINPIFEKKVGVAQTRPSTEVQPDTQNLIKPCVVCLINCRDIVYMPCRHLAICHPCYHSGRVKLCPLCRGECYGIKIYH